MGGANQTRSRYRAIGAIFSGRLRAAMCADYLDVGLTLALPKGSATSSNGGMIVRDPTTGSFGYAKMH